MPSNKVLGAVAVSGALAVGALFGATLGNPVTSGAESAASTTTAPAHGPGPGRPDGDHGRGFGRGLELDAAARAIGITTEQLRAELQDGKTIAAVAKEKGVDRQKVIDAMVAAGEKRLDEAKAALPEAVANIVDGKRPAGAPDGPPDGGGPWGDRGHRGPGGRGEGLAAAAKVLGMTEADLGTALRSGKTLAQVAKEKGVPVQKLVDALVAEAKARLAAAVKAGRITQAQADERLKDLTARITDRVNGTHPEGGPGHP